MQISILKRWRGGLNLFFVLSCLWLCGASVPTISTCSIPVVKEMNKKQYKTAKKEDRRNAARRMIEWEAEEEYGWKSVDKI